MSRLDCIYVAASARDGRFTRICVASIRRFYPDVAIKLLLGGPLEAGLQDELTRTWNVGVAELPVGDWGWGFVKLEPLFGPPGERFLVLDSDTAFAGEALAPWAGSTADFLVDQEPQSEDETRRLYYDWQKVAAVDPDAAPPDFVFNSGQWFGTRGLLHRSDFAPFVDWSSMPPRLRQADLFMPGDQGVLNYVINRKARDGTIRVERRKIMRWPGHGMDGISADTIAKGEAPPLIVHWAGMKKARLGSMTGADALNYFERLYYSRLSHSAARRILAAGRYQVAEWTHGLKLKVRLRLARWAAAGKKTTA